MSNPYHLVTDATVFKALRLGRRAMRNPRFSWHKLKCPTCGRVERYRGLARIGAPGHRCMTCHGPTKVIEMHWGPEKYAQSRGKTGLVEKLTPQEFYAPFPPGTRY